MISNLAFFSFFLNIFFTDAPDNVNIVTDGSLVTGNDATLRCTASSVTAPRDHGQPMRFRWFEAAAAASANRAKDGGEQPGTFEWSEIISPGLGDTSYDLDQGYYGNNEDDDVEDAAGSGGAEPEVATRGGRGGGSGSGSLSDTLEVAESLDRSDEGRRFACSASEGLGLWSRNSQAFVLRPECEC